LCCIAFRQCIADAREKAEGRSIFKRSHIAAWMDEPDSYKMCDVDVLVQDMSMVSDADAKRWGLFIDKMHKQGKLRLKKLAFDLPDDCKACNLSVKCAGKTVKADFKMKDSRVVVHLRNDVNIQRDQAMEVEMTFDKS